MTVFYCLANRRLAVVSVVLFDKCGFMSHITGHMVWQLVYVTDTAQLTVELLRRKCRDICQRSHNIIEHLCIKPEAVNKIWMH
jgi:hypothetical protein